VQSHSLIGGTDHLRRQRGSGEDQRIEVVPAEAVVIKPPERRLKFLERRAIARCGHGLRAEYQAIEDVLHVQAGDARGQRFESEPGVPLGKIGWKVLADLMERDRESGLLT